MLSLQQLLLLLLLSAGALVFFQIISEKNTVFILRDNILREFEPTTIGFIALAATSF